MRRRLGELLILAVAAAALGCSEKDATKCQEALDGTRKSLAASDPVLIGQCLQDGEDLESEARSSVQFLLQAITPR